MNRSRYFAAMTALALTLIGAAQAQAPQEQTSEARALALVKEVQAQQAQLAANQEQINAKLVALGEAIRVARIYAGRGGR